MTRRRAFVLLLTLLVLLLAYLAARHWLRPSVDFEDEMVDARLETDRVHPRAIV